MKKQILKKKKPKEHGKNKLRHYSLGELISIVSAYALNKAETIAVLSHLFRSGKVVIQSGHTIKRLRLAPTS